MRCAAMRLAGDVGDDAMPPSERVRSEEATREAGGPKKRFPTFWPCGSRFGLIIIFRGQGQGWGSFVLLDGGYVEGYGAPFTIMHS